MINNTPHFIIKKTMQKSNVTGRYFSDVVTPDVLKGVCKALTGLELFSYEYVENDYQDEFLEATYNKGRMAVMKFNDLAYFISFSEQEINARNSSLQSVCTAFNQFFNCKFAKKKLCYYFLSVDGNIETDYFIFMYRLMITIGFDFINASSALKQQINAFASIEDIMNMRRVNTGRNKSNNPTFITKSTINKYEIYGKTYGANKYETSMICYAVSLLAKYDHKVTIYMIKESSTDELPNVAQQIIEKMKKIDIVRSDRQLDKNEYEQNNSLRSPRFIYHLLAKLGKKKCMLCECEIPELIQGAHIWPVAQIKKTNLSIDEKLAHSTSGDNGIWLCENHHKLLDENLVFINTSGSVYYNSNLNNSYLRYLNSITTCLQLPSNVLSEQFVDYLQKRQN